MLSCSWFRCEAEAEIKIGAAAVAGNGAPVTEFAGLGFLCKKHAVELSDTLVLYRDGNKRRAAAVPMFDEAPSLPVWVPPDVARPGVYDHRSDALAYGSVCHDARPHPAHDYMAILRETGARVVAHCPGHRGLDKEPA